MFDHHNSNCRKAGLVMLFTAAILVFANPVHVFAHGGKSHGDNSISALQAVQKATELYDRLIGMQKLPEEWETGLTSIYVRTRKSEGRNEFIVEFKRAIGEPGSVYFFFDRKGEYSGSNFTGK